MLGHTDGYYRMGYSTAVCGEAPMAVEASPTTIDNLIVLFEPQKHS